ncbi:DUF6351 family protein [Microbacterium caowuchunii]|uniref:DUF6351 domain-containing protein n=1 Tax=Microbacterium caowuchunii TaxID=2614638 RepID=A0A5N0TIE0_9MICO|nr:DUF6351 family protein [Microbacterium caowuchunii]KAA9134268.1 hypothetical protein F6B40_07680 [Microbacterium caowuchunii]
MTHRPFARLWTCTAAVAGLIISLALPSAAAAVADEPGLDVSVVSSRPDSVTGGDALVRVAGAGADVRVTAAGIDVTDVFVPHGDGLIGLVDGLPLGVSDLAVESGGERAVVEVENHPITGPVFSGPQHPMYCTASASPWNLGEVDEDCHVAAATVSHQYRNTAGRFVAYPADGTVPADLATTTVDGRTVPYVVRVERGTINRAVYETAVLHQPGDPEPAPDAAPTGWNGKLAYTFGGACGVGYWQGTSTGGVLTDVLLERGYAVASATFNVYAQNCNDVTSAETAMMVKEHVIEQLGPVTYTIGWGGSAGTMQQLLLANNYPGILDGVMGDIGYPDERTTTVTGHDCSNLLGYWASAEGAGWTDEQKLAVTGQAVMQTCVGFSWFTGVDTDPAGCNALVPVEARWSPENPDGLRCTISDMVKNVYGVDEEGRALRPIPDAVGLQYGLSALRAGVISVDQFLSLNANAGGFDIDGARTTDRSAASVEAITRAFETGRVNTMTGGLASTPVIEIRPYADLSGDFHDRYRSAIIRERMLAAHGDAATHVSWTSGSSPASSGPMRAQALTQLEQWLDNIIALGGPASRERTVEARPAGLTDGCFDASGTFISEPLDYADPAKTCNQLYPYHSDPRFEAGEPLTRDVLKCELIAPVRGDYPEMTDEQWQALQEVFGAGVCDWSKPSQGRAELIGTWLDFGTTERVVLGEPQLRGDAWIGRELAVEVTVDPAATLTYQWLADGSPIAGAEAATFAVTEQERGATLTVRVGTSLPDRVAVTRVSAASAVVTDVPVEPTPTPTPDVPTPEPTEPDAGAWASVDVGDGRVVQGGTLLVRVSGLAPGQQIAAQVQSDPLVVRDVPAAGADGRVEFRVTIPASFPVGAHAVVISTAGESDIRTPITVVRAGALGMTGAEAPWGIALLAAGILCLGGMTYALRGRRTV